MKVVIFCGGLGMRLRSHAENVPKPMVPLGYRPILWHLMKYYAHYGHKDFILCLGYRGDLIKHYFLNYEEFVTNDFVLSEGGRRRELLSSDIDDWRITFVDTGLQATVGERLLSVKEHLEGERMFLANYADGLTDLVLPEQIAAFEKSSATACFLAVKPNLSYHFLTADDHGLVTSFRDIEHSGLRVNGGYFVLRPEIFKYIKPGEDLVAEPFARLLKAKKLLAHNHDGFWLPMDTAKDRQRFDDLFGAGNPPWFVWRSSGA
jgi:glucose-1-phosphate cytidylyltransferase